VTMLGDHDDDDLFGYPDRPGFVAGCDTSEAAAASLDDLALSRLRRMVLARIMACGVHGATCDEIEVTERLRHQSASARVGELVLGGLIADCGRRRRTRSGRPARVYVMARAK